MRLSLRFRGCAARRETRFNLYKIFPLAGQRLPEIWEPKFREKGVHVLDAPVSGGKSGAQTRNLAVMVGGDKAVFDQVKPLLDAFGDKVFYAGEIGAGSVPKNWFTT
ncbi:MAG: hypothetical protein CM1200mP27_02050 [Chloroflexota bacterium]|nr:MAG: hypothetical protein CM1200mP27_02050 [Chloroflexota bacterium]